MWHDLDEVENTKEKSHASSWFYDPGVYKIRLADQQSEPFTIKRLIGNDEGGILQVGKANKLGNRLLQFYKAYKKNGKTHCEGMRLKRIIRTRSFNKNYQGWKLQFSQRRVQNPAKSESNILHRYFRRYGELPPLNNSEPKRKLKGAVEKITQ